MAVAGLGLDGTEFTCLKALVLFKPHVPGLGQGEQLQIEVLQDQTGLMLQGGAALSPDIDPRDGQPRECIFELKCEVIWGRVYFCELVLGGHPGPTQLFYLRGQ